MSDPKKVEGVVLIHGPVREALTERQLVAYRGHRESFIDWLAHEGKDPDSLEGYSLETYKTYANIVCKFHRTVWEDEEYTLSLTHDHADQYITDLVRCDQYSESHLHNTRLALKAYFRYKENEWESPVTISNSETAANPKEFVTREERSALRDAVLEYGSVPAYAALSPEKRTDWKRELARRFGKPMTEISREDWDRANGYKYPSIVYVSLDAGLRPIEVARARTSWFDTQTATLTIPMNDAAKNTENWRVSLREDTAEFAKRWMEERRLYEKYDDTDRMWLTRHGNPYRSGALQVLLNNLRDVAGIDRDLSWYAIRHSTGTFMAHEEGLAAAQSQLRHKRSETTMKYDNVPLNRRREALDRMG